MGFGSLFFEGTSKQKTIELRQNIATQVSGPVGLLALSAKGEYLYAAISSQQAVQRVDLATNQASPPFRVDFNLPQSSFDITAIQVLPSSPDTVVLARSNNGGLVILDAGAARPDDSIATQIETTTGPYALSQIAVTDSAIFIPSFMSFVEATATGFEPCYDRIKFDSYGLRQIDHLCDAALSSVPEIRREPGFTAIVQNSQYSLVQFPAAGLLPSPSVIQVNPVRARLRSLNRI